MNCDRCKLNEACVHIKEIGSFCLDCNNDLVAELYGIEITNDYEQEITISDADKVKHHFRISNWMMPGFSTWRAEEINGGYEFEVLVKPEDNQKIAITRLHRKIKKGLGYKTLGKLQNEHYYDNGINIGKKQYSLNRIGTGRIVQSDDDAGASFVIDGQYISLSQFGRALTTFTEFILDFQIKDKSEFVLGKNMVLKPVSIYPDDVFEHFQRTLNWFLERNFLSYKQESACYEAVAERIVDLTWLYRYGSKEDAVQVGERMKRQLASIDNDAESFPDNLIALIDLAIGSSTDSEEGLYF